MNKELKKYLSLLDNMEEEFVRIGKLLGFETEFYLKGAFPNENYNSLSIPRIEHDKLKDFLPE